MPWRTFFAALTAAFALIYGGRAPAAFLPDFLNLSAPLYAELPDIASCRAGQLQHAERLAVLARVNDIRQRHGLAPVSRDTLAEPAVDQAALMLAANGRLEHNPPGNWRCFSAAGAGAASNSLLSGGVTAPNIAFHTPAQDIIAWLTDANAVATETIGHRRLLLDPFLKSVAYGRVSGKVGPRRASVGSVLKVTGPGSALTAGSGSELIAWPYHDYPQRYFTDGAYLSVSLLIDRTRKQANAAVDFSAARVSVVTESGRAMPVRNIRFDNQYYGLPNNLQFMLPRIEPNVRYEISIDGVNVRGEEKSYRYWFRIMPDGGDRA